MDKWGNPYFLAVVLYIGLNARTHALDGALGFIGLQPAEIVRVEGMGMNPASLLGMEAMDIGPVYHPGSDSQALHTTDLLGIGTLDVVTSAAVIQADQGIAATSDPWLKLKLDDNPDTVGRNVGLGRILPDVTLKLGYNDNLTFDNDDPINTFYTRITPHSSYVLGSRTRKIILDYLLDAAVYEGSSKDDYLDNRLRAGFDYNPTSRIFASLNGEFLDSHDGRGTGRAEGGTGATQTSLDKWHHWGLGGKFTYGAQGARGRAEIEAQYLSKVYYTNRQFTRTRDLDTLTGIGRFFYRVRPKTSLLFEGRMTGYNYMHDPLGQPSLDSIDTTLFTGVTWQATYKTTGFAKLGYTYKSFASDRLDNTGMPSWEVGVDWRPKTYSTVNFATAQRFEETEGTGDVIETSTYQLSWEHAWKARFKTKLDLGYQNSTAAPNKRDDNGYLMAAQANYAFRRWLNLGAGFRHQMLDSSDETFNYDQNVFELTLDLIF